MKSIYPLYELDAVVKSPFKIDKGVSITSNIINPDNIISENLSEEDIRLLTEPRLCLEIENDIIRPEEASIAFIVACRLLKPTRVFIRYRLNASKEVWKIRDDYPQSPLSEATTIIDENELPKISVLYINLNEFKRLNAKTENATYFLSLAYRSTRWLESLIFFVCSLETLVSSSGRENGITEKFTNRINYFTGYDCGDLKDIYKVRSELVHGRYSYVSIEKNFQLLKTAEEVSRIVFSKILLNNNILNYFYKDEDRMKLFQKI